MRLRTLPVFLAFLAMGFGDAVGPFVSLAKQQFNLSTTVATLIPLVGFSMFGLLSVPVGLWQDKRGKKFILMLGLGIALAGMLSASIGISTFPLFLGAVLLLGAGAAVLQVAGNPIMRDVSEEGKFARNLTMGQFVKAIGSLSGPLIPVIAARYFGADWTVIFPIYAGALLIAVLAVSGVQWTFRLVELDRVRAITIVVARGLTVRKQESGQKPATLGSCLSLLSNGYVLAMVMGIFLYVGAEVCLSSGIPLFLEQKYQIDINRVGLLGTGLFFMALTIGRFCGGVVLNWMAPRKFLLVTCAASILGLLGLFIPVATVAAVSFFVAGLGFANVFPLVFSIAVDHMPARANELSGLMVTAIVGGAILPPIMGFVADHSTMQLGFLVPLAAIVYITAIALANQKNRAAEAAAR